jgi:hypothetical protein
VQTGLGCLTVRFGKSPGRAFVLHNGKQVLQITAQAANGAEAAMEAVERALLKVLPVGNKCELKTEDLRRALKKAPPQPWFFGPVLLSTRPPPASCLLRASERAARGSWTAPVSASV